ncbi:porin [Myxococcus sp. RHSTA-1-4]|uniref:porin n=1 Tax=Myxococcus sp. RHSTA-1-4 TaxID=2874601 RepID=UPI001CBB6873|nr:porin [Myxococcus sp. RHSTA-1-4]MBZ4417243.1 OprO/OprP family phosphate-selective porin [Myxococcus sp. RHSTA-1-4]
MHARPRAATFAAPMGLMSALASERGLRGLALTALLCLPASVLAREGEATDMARSEAQEPSVGAPGAGVPEVTTPAAHSGTQAQPGESSPAADSNVPEAGSGPTDVTGARGLISLPAALGSVEVSGRISVREAVDAPRGGAWEGGLSIPAARLELTYRLQKRLRAVVELDVRGELKDAFVWLNLSHGFAVRAGQFKIPLSLVELESTRRLPLVRRGLVRDVLDDALGMSGRSPGAQAEWKCGDCGLALLAGVYQSRDVDDDVALDKGLGLMPAVRATWDLGRLEVGASALYQPTASSVAGSGSGWMSGLDASHSLSLGVGALRTWAEVRVGRSPLLTGTQGSLLTGRLLTAFRIGGVDTGRAYVEPFVMVSALDPDLQSPDDSIWEGTGGFNVGLWKQWRLQTQFEVRRTGASFPLLLRSLDGSLVSRRALLVQMEVGF